MGGNGSRSASSFALQGFANARGVTIARARQMVRVHASLNGLNQRQALNQLIGSLNQSAQGNQAGTYQIWAQMSDGQADNLRSSMRQTGDEAGYLTDRYGMSTRGSLDPNSFINGKLNRDARMYIGTGKSMIINSALQNGFTVNQICQPYVYGATFAWHDAVKNGTFKIDQIKQSVRYMDKGMKPLTQNLNASRMETSDMALNSFGAGNLIGKWETMSAKEINRALYDLDRSNAGYTSVSWHDNGLKMGTAKGKDVMIRYTIRQGTDAIVTNNRQESEVIVGRGYTQHITSASKETINGKNTLVLYVEIDPSERPKVVKV